MKPGSDPSLGERRRILYGRRRGRRLRPGREALLADLLPRLAIDVPAEADVPLDPGALFAGGASDPVAGAGNAVGGFVPADVWPEDVWLEIGFGAGEHLAAQALNHPEIGFIGCEPYINGVASLLREIERHGLNNIRVLMDDARALIERLEPASIGRVGILFPDPWPKKRHHKRRFILPANLDALASVLKDEGEFRFASDDAGYVRWTLEHVLDHPDFVWLARGPRSWRERPEESIPTRYEGKAADQGRVCVFLGFQRRRRPQARSSR
ncbi:MAG: tRNA (guanosine(46)-N7)-methyltransferase TrmB [Alphaproteobacteria bacterium]|nr:tRNA (guanosine(46)-N7)-methyltransferase TrmB [Alphaproteobacteria bacterium]